MVTLAGINNTAEGTATCAVGATVIGGGYALASGDQKTAADAATVSEPITTSPQSWHVTLAANPGTGSSHQWKVYAICAK